MNKQLGGDSLLLPIEQSGKRLFAWDFGEWKLDSLEFL